MPDAIGVYRPSERAAQRVSVGAECYAAVMKVEATGGFGAP